ncbi:uncharacterized protein MYCFIDRAFT_181185 [Pseudocercospora fijiensis CIRAD86]|uniref:Uncharacterized protein n=1 Tax=Pseudocercospora fijiensis (strain CIRAD86) TaxID=383855 RepID=N1Q8W5_PSEFD|nr:uncharacterized protein MYCFIDRAFT_181185 [Pseudocercospora fijiensis CIRAD86]EME88221.1 hypothetical protein MYCFIDRAFT_181185 [Pseudocercospora fijiensis CIRAD86]
MRTYLQHFDNINFAQVVVAAWASQPTPNTYPNVELAARTKPHVSTPLLRLTSGPNRPFTFVRSTLPGVITVKHV